MWLDDARRDLQDAARTLRASPGFTAVVVLTLALGVGANTAVFSVVKAVLLQPLAVAHADRLVRVYENVPPAESPDGKPHRFNGMFTRDVLSARGRTRALSHVMAHGIGIVTLAGGSDGVRLSLAPVTSEMFAMLDAYPILGRPFTADDEQPGGDRVVILSYGAWQRYFAGDSQAIGRSIRFNGTGRFSAGIALDAD